MRTISDLITAMGGNVRVAKAIGVSPSGVSEMKRRASIPPRYWKVLIEAADRSGVNLTAEELVAMHSFDTAEPAA